MKKRYLVIILLLVVGLTAVGQISHGGKPYSFSIEETVLKASIAEFVTSEVDYMQMLKEDVEAGRSKPFRYGKVHDVQLHPQNSGTWKTLANGDKIWRLKIKSNGAYSLSLIFDDYKLNKGAKIFLYSTDKKIVRGAFTDENNKSNNWFSTSPIAGEEIVIELNVLAGGDYGVLNISGIVHDYKGTFGLKTGYGSSGSCNVNINCPEGLEWQVEKRSVMKYIVNGWLCSGALINNTANDAKPYVLTAEHCIPDKGSPSNTTFIFNYESENCDGTGEILYQSMVGGDIVATGGNLDFTLLELSQIPPADYNVFYAGWNRKSTPATNTTCIHHPQGDIKKISKDNDPPTIGDYGEGYLINSHWNIGAWELGTTEGGSSGSPLFDENHLIVGDLTGGDASCSYNYNDYYSRFDLSWDYHSEPTKHLKTWLDPLNSGVEELYGFDPNAVTDGLDASLLNVVSPESEFCASNEITPAFVIRNNGTVTLTSAVIKYQISQEKEVLMAWSGNLETNQSEEVVFPDALLPTGDFEIKAFISSPNESVDQNRSNDTITKNFIGYKLINEIVIDGAAEICKGNFSSEYSVAVSGGYQWNVQGGEIIGADSTQQIEVQWNEWGERYLDVNVSNLCNSVDAETLEVEVVEQGFNLTINLDGNGETACWLLLTCDGDTVAEDCDLPASGLYTTSICVSRGCYKFVVISEAAGIKSYSLNRMSDNQVVVSGTDVLGKETIEFFLNASTSDAGINVYPNPADSKIVIEASFIELYESAKFAIFNLRGSALTSYELFDDRKEIDISTLQPGFYIVKVQSIYGEFSKKFVKP
jgi:hypothetical protein